MYTTRERGRLHMHLMKDGVQSSTVSHYNKATQLPHHQEITPTLHFDLVENKAACKHQQLLSRTYGTR